MAFLCAWGLPAAGCSDSTSSTAPAEGGAADATSPGLDAAKEAATTDSFAPDVDAFVAGEAGPDSSAAEAGPADAGSPTVDSGIDVGVDSGVDAGVDSGTASLAALPGYQVSVFATGGTSYRGPDSLELDGAHVWVGYQMGVKAKDGTDSGAPFNSTIVEYNLDGTLAGKSFDISGHADGVRVDPVTHIVWATSNEDGNPVMMSFDPATSTSKTYTLPPMPHGGGLDDLAFLGGKLIVALSSPTGDDAGAFTQPALAQVTVSGDAISLTPILTGNASSGDITVDSGVVAPLSLSDPDSLTVDDKGQLVLVSQADNLLVFIKNPGGTDAGAQSVSKLSVGTQLDDTVWAKNATGYLLVADATANTIYTIKSSFTPGTVYTETPDDSTIPGIVGTVDLATGIVRPVILGFKKPTGMIFVP